MNGAFQLGPLLLPFALLLVLASICVTLVVAGRLSRRAGVDVEGAAWRALIAGLLAARSAFVLEYRSLYVESPLTILDVRDGGWSPAFGLAGALLYALYRQRREPALGKPLTQALASGMALYVLGTASLALRPVTEQALPDLAFTSLAGGTVALSGFAGRPVVVNLWATWCPPCVREMPVLYKAQLERQDVHFVFLNQGEDRDRVSRWLKVQGLPLQNVLVDEHRRASEVFRQNGYPVTLFFDAEGRLVSSRIGELSAATLGARLRGLAR